MSTLFLIRHGQASLGAEDYDNLSPLGREQSALLGPRFTARETVPDQIYVGPRRRHHQTLDAARGAWSERPIQGLDLLDEQQCPEVLRANEETLRERLAIDPDDTKAYLQFFRRGSKMWVRGEVETPPEFESWNVFRSRIDSAMDHLRQDIEDPDARVAVFTSGGVVAAAVGHVLGLDDEKTIELSWSIYNASVTTLHLSRHGFALMGFNELPFVDRRLVTFV